MSDGQNISEESMKWIFYHGARPLWKYLAEILNIDITEVCAFVSKEDTFIETDTCKLSARTVSMPHSNEVEDPLFNNDVCFIINSINTVFETLKTVVQKDDKFILQKYAFKMDGDRNIYLVDVETKESVSDRAIAVIQC